MIFFFFLKKNIYVFHCVRIWFFANQNLCSVSVTAQPSIPYTYDKLITMLIICQAAFESLVQVIGGKKKYNKWFWNCLEHDKKSLFGLNISLVFQSSTAPPCTPELNQILNQPIRHLILIIILFSLYIYIYNRSFWNSHSFPCQHNIKKIKVTKLF